MLATIFKRVNALFLCLKKKVKNCWMLILFAAADGPLELDLCSISLWWLVLCNGKTTLKTLEVTSKWSKFRPCWIFSAHFHSFALLPVHS